MIEGRFGNLGAAVDAVKHAERHAVALLFAVARVEPAHEVSRLGGESEPQESVQRKGRVADPGVAVIPISGSFDFFRKAAGRGGDEGPRRLEGEEFERERRSMDDVPPAPNVLTL